MRIAGRLTLVLFLFYTAAWGEEATYEEKCTAIVLSSINTAQFTFPLPARQVWTWKMKATEDNYLEYAWQVVLGDGTGTGKSDLSFGVYLYKFPGSEETTGSIKQLLFEAQTSVWAKSGDLRQDLAIHSCIEGRKLILRITDKKTFSELFSQKPTTAYCEVATPYKDSNSVSKTPIIFMK